MRSFLPYIAQAIALWGRCWVSDLAIGLGDIHSVEDMPKGWTESQQAGVLASRERFRAVFLTSLTTAAGLTTWLNPIEQLL